MVSTTRAAAVLLVCCLASHCASAEGGPKDSATFTLVRNKILVPVYMGASGPYPFLLDSNATGLSIDATLAEGLKMPKASADGTAATVTLPPLSASDLQLPSQQAATVDLASRSGAAGTGLAGILPCRIGSPALTLDFSDSTFAFGIVPDPRTNYPHATKLRVDEQGFNVDVLFNGKYMTPARVDTTYGSTLAMPEKLAMEVGLVGSATPRLVFEPASPGQAPLDGAMQVRLRSLQIAGAEVREPLCTLLPAGNLPVIGVGFLKHFRVRFDYVENVLALAPIEKDVAVEAPIVGYGVVLGGFQDGYWAIHVAVNAPAYRAGLKSGDRITSINGTSMLGLPYADVATRLAGKNGDKLKLGVMRGQQTIEVSVVAEPLL